MLAEEKEQQWDQEKGEDSAEHLAPRFPRATVRVWQTARDQVLVHWSPLGLESALQSARGLGLALAVVQALAQELAEVLGSVQA